MAGLVLGLEARSHRSGKPSRSFLQLARVQVVGEGVSVPACELALPVRHLTRRFPGEAGSPACPWSSPVEGQAAAPSSDRTAGSAAGRVSSLPRPASQAEFCVYYPSP